MRAITLTFASFGLVCAVAGTAFAQMAPAADPAAAPAADPAAAPAAEPAPAAATAPAAAPAGETASVSTEGASPGKFVVGLRLGYGIAMGSMGTLTEGDEERDLADYVSGQLPIWLDLGYMVTPNIMVGLYGQYGIGFVGSEMSDLCDRANVDCSASVMRFGVQGQYHLSPTGKLDPWLGLGVGYEMASLDMGDVGSVGVSGMEFLNLQGGADFKLSPGFGIGPFLSFSLGQYGSYSTELPDATGATVSRDGDIAETAMHEWLTLGVRGAFNL